MRLGTRIAALASSRHLAVPKRLARAHHRGAGFYGSTNRKAARGPSCRRSTCNEPAERHRQVVRDRQPQAGRCRALISLMERVFPTVTAAGSMDRVARLEAVAGRGPTHADWHQAVDGLREKCGLEGQLYEALRRKPPRDGPRRVGDRFSIARTRGPGRPRQLTSLVSCGWTVSTRTRLGHCAERRVGRFQGTAVARCGGHWTAGSGGGRHSSSVKRHPEL